MTSDSTPPALCAGALLLLLLHLLGLLEALHPLAFLLGLGLVGSHGGEHFFLGDKGTADVGLGDGHEQGNPVVVAQTRRIVVEPEEEHQRHQVQHNLHTRHRLGRSLRLAGDPVVQDVGTRHQEAEETQVVTQDIGNDGNISYGKAED